MNSTIQKFRRSTTKGLAVLAAVVGIGLSASPALASTNPNPYPVDQIGILVPFDTLTTASPNGPYVPDPASALVITTTNAGCTWSTNASAPAPTGGSEAKLSGVVFSFTTRSFGEESGGTFTANASPSTTGTIEFDYSGVNASVLCPKS